MIGGAPGIVDLPEVWREAGSLDCWADDCANELEAILPKWTRITEDEDTWPEGLSFIAGKKMSGEWDYSIRNPSGETFHHVAKHCLEVYWRPLCDLDYPPEQS